MPYVSLENAILLANENGTFQVSTYPLSKKLKIKFKHSWGSGISDSWDEKSYRCKEEFIYDCAMGFCSEFGCDKRKAIDALCQIAGAKSYFLRRYNLEARNGEQSRKGNMTALANSMIVSNDAGEFRCVQWPDMDRDYRDFGWSIGACDRYWRNLRDDEKFRDLFNLCMERCDEFGFDKTNAYAALLNIDGSEKILRGLHELYFYKKRLDQFEVSNDRFVWVVEYDGSIFPIRDQKYAMLVIKNAATSGMEVKVKLIGRDEWSKMVSGLTQSSKRSWWNEAKSYSAIM